MKSIYILIVLFIQFGAIRAQVDRSHEPTPDKPKEINLGDLKSIELDNGLKVFLVPKPGYGKFAFSLTVTQPDIDTDEQPELREVLGKLYYNNQSKHYTKQQSDSIIAYSGAKMGITVNGGFVIGLNDNIKELMALYRDRLLYPSMTPEEIKEIKDKAIEKYAKKKLQKENKREITAIRNFQAILRDSLLNDGVDKVRAKNIKELDFSLVNPNRLKAFQEERIVAGHSTAILIGDFTPKKAEILLKKYFGDWQKGAPFVKETSHDNKPMFLPSRKIFVIDNPLAVQANITLYWNLGDAYMYSEDMHKLEVMNQILGGYTGSYIYKNLREDKGLCYSAFASISPNGAGGTGFVKTNVRTDVASLALENIFYEMLRIRNQKVSEDDLRLAQNSLIGAYARSLGGVALQRFLSFAMVKDDYNLPDDYLKTYPLHIGSITIDDVYEMAIKYVKPNNCLVLIEGNAEQLKGKLEAYGPVEYYTKEGERIEE